MSQTPTLSLVIPAYNRGALIDETLASALAQQAPFAEIVVVDNGSTDDTPARLAAYGERITVITVPNVGVQKARNIGVAACSSSHVALCDSDDLLAPGFVETMLRLVAEQPRTDIWYCNFVTFTAGQTLADKLARAPEDFLDGAVRGDGYCVDIPDLYRRVLRYQPFFPSGSVISKGFYDDLRGYDAQFNRVGGEDFEFLLRAICKGRLGYATAPLVSVRKHESNDSRDALRMLLGEIRILEHSLARHPGAARYRAEIEASIYQRRRAAFDAAYARGDFSVVEETAEKFAKPPTDPNYRLKRVISRFPSPVRDMVWRLSQARRQPG